MPGDTDWRRSRLNDLQKAFGGKTALGKRLGYADGAFVGQMIRGDRPITEKTVEAIEALQGCAGWFEPKKARSETPFLPGFEALSIPLLANSGSMGFGNDQMHDEVVVGRLTVMPDWVMRTLKPTRMDALRFIHGYGDSMDPTFKDGDILLVDTGVQDAKIDGIYVLEANDRVYIKRVRQRMNGEFEISSDNTTVKTVDVLDGRSKVEIRGRVLWAWNGKKL